MASETATNAIELFADEHDDLEFLETVQAIINGVIDAHHPGEVYLTRIDNWFDYKWLSFSGKAMGAAGFWKKKLTIPPFHPHRVVGQQYYNLGESSERYTVATAPKPVHIRQVSHDNFSRDISRLSDSAVMIWFSSDTQRNHRGSLMVYTSSKDHQEGWYLSLDRSPNKWQLTTHGIAIEVVQFLEATGRRMHNRQRRMQWRLFSELLIAVMRGDVAATKDLMEKGSLQTREEESTVLMTAASRGSIEIMRQLLDRGADVNASTGDGVTALMWAAANGRLEAVRLLVDAGANVDARRSDGETAMACAAYNGQAGAVELLLEYGADVNAQEPRLPPLHYAVFKGWLEIIRILVSAGVDMSVKDSHGYSALDLARLPQHKFVQHHEEILGLLQSRAAVATQ